MVVNRFQIVELYLIDKNPPGWTYWNQLDSVNEYLVHYGPLIGMYHVAPRSARYGMEGEKKAYLYVVLDD